VFQLCATTFLPSFHPSRWRTSSALNAAIRSAKHAKNRSRNRRDSARIAAKQRVVASRCHGKVPLVSLYHSPTWPGIIGPIDDRASRISCGRFSRGANVTISASRPVVVRSRQGFDLAFTRIYAACTRVTRVTGGARRG